MHFQHFFPSHLQHIIYPEKIPALTVRVNSTIVDAQKKSDICQSLTFYLVMFNKISRSN